MSGIANLSMDHSKSDECLNKTSSPPPPESSLKPNSSGANLSSQGGGDSETMNCLIASSRFEVSKTSADGSQVLLHDNDGAPEDQQPLNNTMSSEEHDQSSPIGSYDGQHTYGAPTYRTVYQTNKSLRHYTKEAIPKIDNYRNMMSIQGQLVRPTVEELRGIQATYIDPSTVSWLLFYFFFSLSQFVRVNWDRAYDTLSKSTLHWVICTKLLSIWIRNIAASPFIGKLLKFYIG